MKILLLCLILVTSCFRSSKNDQQSNKSAAKINKKVEIAYKRPRQPIYMRNLFALMRDFSEFSRALTYESKNCELVDSLREELSLFSHKDLIVKQRKWQQAREKVKGFQDIIVNMIRDQLIQNDESCLLNRQKLVVDLRYLIDTLYIWEYDLFTKMDSIGWKNDYLWKDSSLKKGQNPIVAIYPNKQENYKSGDIMVTLGDFISSFFAHVSDHANPFSHSMILTKQDDEPLSIIDSVFEQDARIRDFSREYIFTNHTRIAQYRFEDTQLAHRASRWLYQSISDLEKQGKRYKFDLFVIDGNDEYNCLELIQEGFKKESNSKVNIPIRHDIMSDKKKIIWNYVLDERAPTIVNLPSALEWDKRFTLVNEYRNLNSLVQGQILEVIARKLIEVTTSTSFQVIYKLLSTRYRDFNHHSKNIHVSSNLMRRIFDYLVRDVVDYIKRKKVENHYGPSHFQLRRFAMDISINILEIKDLFKHRDVNLYQTLKANEKKK